MQQLHTKEGFLRNWKVHTFTKKKGGYTVEAVIFLPIFIIAILTLSYVMKVAYIEERIAHILSDEMRRTSAEAYISKLNLSPHESFFELIGSGNGYLALNSRIDYRVEEMTETVIGLHLDDFDYLTQKHGIEDAIFISVCYDIPIRFPVQIYKGFSVKQQMMTRGFTGKKYQYDPFNFSELELADESRLVYVFPRMGERYHEAYCQFVQTDCVQKVLTNRLKESFAPCKLCNADQNTIGSLVYCFYNSGNVYHNYYCNTVDRYYIAIDFTEAVGKGYAPCKTCSEGGL